MAAHAPVHTLSPINRPSADDADRLVARTRADFQRLLAQWASDCLELRRTSLIRPVWTEADRDWDRWMAQAA